MRMKRTRIIPAAIMAAAVLLAAGCKAQEEIVNVPTPKPEAQQVVIENKQDEPQHTITVHGAGDVAVPADYATIVLGVRGAAETAEAATLACTEDMDAVLTSAKELGVTEESIKAGAVDIAPEINEPDGATVGYLATQTVTLTADNAQLSGGVLSAIVDSSVADLVSVTYGLRDASGAYLEALAVAMADASARAAAIAEASNVRLGAVVGVVEDVSADSDVAGKVYDKSEIAVPAGVTVTYRIP